MNRNGQPKAETNTAASIQIDVDSRLGQILSRDEVSRFVAEHSDATPFDCWAWLNSVFTADDAHSTLLVVARSSGGGLLGWLPLQVCRETFAGVSLNILRFAQHPHSDRHGIMVVGNQPAILECMIGAVLKERRDCKAIILDEILSSMHKRQLQRKWKFETTRQSPILEFDFGDRDTLRASYSKSLRKRLNRARGKLNKLDSETRFWCPSAAELNDLFQEIKDVETVSWKGQAGVGVFANDSSHKQLVQSSIEMAEDGAIGIGTIRIDGELATYRFGYVWRGWFFDYNFAYLPEFSRLSLGRVMLDDIVLQAVDDGLKGVDGSRIGHYSGNLLTERATKYIPHERWMVFRRSVFGQLLKFKYLIAKPLKRKLTKSTESHAVNSKKISAAARANDKD